MVGIATTKAVAAATAAAAMNSFAQQAVALAASDALVPSSSNLSGISSGAAGGNGSKDRYGNASELGYLYEKWKLNDNLESVITPIVFGFIFVVGLVGNGTLIVSVLANKVMRNVPNILIVSLSMGDFLLILVSVPLTATLYSFGNWPYGTLACKFNEFLQTLSLGVSVFTLMALSADRYVAIVDPMAKLTGRTTRTTIFIAAGIWVVAFMCSIPDAVFATVITHQFQTNKTEGYKGLKLTFCNQYPFEMEDSYPQVFFLARLLVFFILPILTIAIFYIKMARVLMKSSDNLPMENKSAAANHCRQIAARKRVAFVVLSFVVIFMVCWLPRHVYLMWYHFGQSNYNEFWHAFKITGFCLKFINSCINPFACYFLSGQFRKYYNRYLFCCCRRRHYTSLENRATLHTLNSTTRRSSPTNVSVLQSQSAF